jgi:3-oxoacyl-[acyl-carrier-protein] synthase-3
MLRRNMNAASQPALPRVGVVGLATYVPTPRMTSAELAAATGIAEDVIVHKFGIRQKPMPGPDDHPCAMGAKAAERALAQAGIDPLEVDVVISIARSTRSGR